MNGIGEAKDWMALYDLNYRYAYYVDCGKAEAWSELFTIEAFFDESAFANPVFRGRDEIRAYGELLAATVPHIVHHVTNIIIDDLTADTAVGAVFSVVESKRESGSHSRNHVLYRDRYKKIGEKWLISERILERAFPSEVVSESK